MEQRTRVFIIIGAVLGTAALSGLMTLGLVCRKRTQRRLRGFSLRSATPLDDAEFESWRRPSQYTQRPEKYGIRSSQPVLVRDRVCPTSPTLFEKEEPATYDFPTRTSSPTDLAPVMTLISDTVRRPERARRKSSVASSVADRPPTPYSTSSPSSPLIHQTPSISEASAFKFDFKREYGTQSNDNLRWI